MYPHSYPHPCWVCVFLSGSCLQSAGSLTLGLSQAPESAASGNTPRSYLAGLRRSLPYAPQVYANCTPQLLSNNCSRLAVPRFWRHAPATATGTRESLERTQRPRQKRRIYEYMLFHKFGHAVPNEVGGCGEREPSTFVLEPKWRQGGATTQTRVQKVLCPFFTLTERDP